MWVSLVVILPLFWKGITCQVRGYSIQVPPDVGVQEGLCVTIPCNFTADYRKTFSNSTGYWIQIRKQEPLYPFSIVATNNENSNVTKTNFHLTGNPDIGDCTLTITDARKEDQGRYFFRFEESKESKVKYTYYRDTTTINVTDLTEEPVISELGILIAGISKTLTCSPPKNCSVASLYFQLKKSNVADVWKKNSPTVTFTPSPSDHQENITCEMTNSEGKTTRKTVFLDVYYCAHTTMDSTIIIGMVIGNIMVLILIFVGIYFYMNRKMEKRQLERSPAPGTQGTESTYQKDVSPSQACLSLQEGVPAGKKTGTAEFAERTEGVLRPLTRGPTYSLSDPDRSSGIERAKK
ncbi:sialic acid-binding Ig-like lectin 5 isoform X2 [Phyllobates terribilis]|uniref:sialic acid-binding Ig-like lectin 5 isoform X2 n=1 Tax=Phyllobates terribilis TaxID=111132 RepID=UPI003CCB4D02